MWDANQYLKFAGERSRPFFDLMARVQREQVQTVVDLGCGPGELTYTLAERWPAARVLGVDTSPEMLTQAAARALPGRLRFVPGDIATWRPDEPIDLIVSNAALQWVGDHPRLLADLVRMLAPGGTLAVQMPRHFGTPAQQAIDETTRAPRWRPLLEGVGLQADCVRPLLWYVQELYTLGLVVDAWETIYLHVLTGTNPVLEWVKGTALRPFLQRLESQDAQAFLEEVGHRLRAAYASQGGRTIFPFPRIFFVATRPA
jgi:trans-aconitate 2-methyltransferase